MSLPCNETRRTAILRRAFLDEDGRLRAWTAPAALLVVAILGYGLYARQLGFYWDDWTFAWARFFRGLAGMKATFFINRPMRAYVEYVFGLFLGVSPFAWQLFSLLMRWAAAVSLWWFLRLLWPRFRRVQFTVALLALVYPGFSQQSQAMNYAYYWVFQAVFFLSLAIMFWGLRTPRRLLVAMIVAVLLSTVQLFSSEYLIGLELMRPLFIWLALSAIVPPRQRLVRTLLFTLPFLAVMGVYFYWRVFLFKFPTYQPVLLEMLRTNFPEGVRAISAEVIHDVRTAVVDGWLRVVQVPVYEWREARFAALYPLVVLASLAGLLLYQDYLPPQDPSGGVRGRWKQGAVREMLVVGLLAVLMAGIPFYSTGLTVEPVFSNDRLTMPFFFGVGLLLVAVMELCLNAPKRAAVVSLLAALAIGVQFYNGFLYRNESELQQGFAWQLAWRAPAIRPGTILLSDDTVFPYTDDEALAFLVNWIYAPENHSAVFAYAYNTLSDRLGTALAFLGPHVAISQDFYASATFQGTTDQALVLVYAPPGCLRILNPVYDSGLIFQPVYWSGDGTRPTVRPIASLPPLTERALPLSNLDRIVPDPQAAARPPAFVLGPEPAHSWCYYFEKADLARQTGDWVAVAALGDEALIVHALKPADLSEYLPFIEADGHLGRWSAAEQRSQDLIRRAPVMKPSLCAVWQRLAKAGSNGIVTSVEQGLQCSP
jgi:hypothetical protein